MEGILGHELGDQPVQSSWADILNLPIHSASQPPIELEKSAAQLASTSNHQPINEVNASDFQSWGTHDGLFHSNDFMTIVPSSEPQRIGQACGPSMVDQERLDYLEPSTHLEQTQPSCSDNISTDDLAQFFPYAAPIYDNILIHGGTAYNPAKRQSAPTHSEADLATTKRNKQNIYPLYHRKYFPLESLTPLVDRPQQVWNQANLYDVLNNFPAHVGSIPSLPIFLGVPGRTFHHHTGSSEEWMERPQHTGGGVVEAPPPIQSLERSTMSDLGEQAQQLHASTSGKVDVKSLSNEDDPELRRIFFESQAKYLEYLIKENTMVGTCIQSPPGSSNLKSLNEDIRLSSRGTHEDAPLFEQFPNQFNAQGVIGNGSDENQKPAELRRTVFQRLVFDEKAFNAENIASGYFPQKLQKIVEWASLLSKATSPTEQLSCFKTMQNGFKRVKRLTAGPDKQSKSQAQRASRLRRKADEQLKRDTTMALWRESDLWFEYWEVVSGMNLQEYCHPTSKRFANVRPPYFSVTFLFYVEMIDTVLSDLGIFTKTDHSKLFEEALDQCRAMEKDFDWSRGLTNEEVRVWREQGKVHSRTKEGQTFEVIWKFLEFWMRNSSKLELRGFVGGLKRGRNKIQASFDDLFGHSIWSFNSMLRERHSKCSGN